MREKRRDFIPFSFYDLTGMEERLEEMSQRGWLLERMSNLCWTYRRAEPRKRHFTVTYTSQVSAFEPDLTEGQLTFQDFCRHTGWELAAFNGPFQVYYNELENPIPIETDPNLELEMIGKIARRNLPVYIFFILLGLWMGASWYYSLFHDPITLLARPTSLMTGLCWLLLFLYGAADTVTYFAWRRKAKAAAQRGEFLPTRGCHRLMQGILVVLVLGLLYVFFTARLPGFRLLLGLLIFNFLVLYGVVNGTKALLKRKKVSAKVNRAVTLTVDVVLAFALMGGLTFGLLRAAQTGRFSLEAYLELPLHVEDLVNQDTADYISSSGFEDSVFLSQRRYAHRPDFGAEKAGQSRIEYTMVDVKVPFLYGLCFRELYHDYDDWGDYTGVDAGTTPYYVYQEMEALPAGTTAVYQLWSYGTPTGRYLLCWEDRLVTLEANWVLTEEQLVTAAAKLAG